MYLLSHILYVYGRCIQPKSNDINLLISEMNEFFGWFVFLCYLYRKLDTWIYCETVTNISSPIFLLIILFFNRQLSISSNFSLFNDKLKLFQHFCQKWYVSIYLCVENRNEIISGDWIWVDSKSKHKTRNRTHSKGSSWMVNLLKWFSIKIIEYVHDWLHRKCKCI